ncbi:hypothetical protein [Phenylobacterium sp.]|uniref:tetratricopeptide repeat protein n=1 Tax=Phenylobacterium sp. TaxID=1871053 RepID=UPI0039187A18
MNGTVDESEGGAADAADRFALRRLFERVRAHVEITETRGRESSEPRRAARELEHVAGELARVADDLARRLARADDDRVAALRALAGDVADRAGRLDALAAAGAIRLQDRLDGVVERLAQWEAAATGADRSLGQALEQRLGADEIRRRHEIAGLTPPVHEREPRRPHDRSEAPFSNPSIRGAQPPRRSSRSAAFLMSAGVACLGLATLAVVLEPPFPRHEPLAGKGTPLVLRGPILVEPPRYAYAPDLSVPPPPAEPEPPDAATPKDLAAVMRDFEAGRPGALSALRAKATAGDPRAQMYLARQYETGRGGVPADPVQARQWTTRAADAGDPVGMHNLALYYLQGRGGPRDDAAAARLLRKAAAAGVPDSQFNLGLLYETGAGVERNLVEAYKWFQIAANSGDLKARARAIALEDRLSRKELASADRDAQRFAAGRGAPAETPLIPGAETVAEAQRKLARMGLYIGPTDGQETPAYRQAVEAFRRSEPMQPEAIGLFTSGS